MSPRRERKKQDPGQGSSLNWERPLTAPIAARPPHGHSKTNLRSRVGDALTGAFDKELAFPLGEARHDVDDHLVCGAARVECGVQHLDVDVALGKVGDGCHRFMEVPAQAVEAGHDEGATGTHARESLSETRTGPLRPRDFVAV